MIVRSRWRGQLPRLGQIWTLKGSIYKVSYVHARTPGIEQPGFLGSYDWGFGEGDTAWHPQLDRADHYEWHPTGANPDSRE